jgi:Uri superfamily endonuclease
MKGIYSIVAFLKKGQKIKIGRLGVIDFKKGYYIYVGSALNSLESRMRRHLQKRKKLRWHVDYLLEKARVVDILYKETEEKLECEFARELAENFACIKGFGSSDCSCESHLFYSERDPRDKLGDFLDAV